MSSYRWLGRRQVKSGDKYGNKAGPCQLGHSHRSKLEAAVCNLLQLRERAGEIKDLQVEDHVTICGPSGHPCDHKCRIQYVADFKFTVTESGEFVWAEAKGFETPEWRLKLRMWRHNGPGDLEIYMGSHTRISLREVVHPKGGK